MFRFGLFVFLAFAGLSFSQSNSQTNVCRAEPCHCDGTCGDTCTPFALDTIDNDREPERGDVLFDEDFDPGLTISSADGLELHAWQLSDIYKGADFEALASTYPAETARLMSELEDVSIEQLRIEFHQELDRELLPPAEEVIPEIQIGELEPRLSVPLFDGIAIEEEDVPFLDQHRPDIRPTDPGMGGGADENDELSDVVKQTDPDDVRRCKISVDRISREPPNECRQSVERLCAGGCSNEDLKSRLADPQRRSYLKGLLADYDHQCLDRFDREDQASKAPFDTDYVLARSGALFIDPDAGTPLCRDRLSSSQKTGGPFVFCSAAVLDDNTIVTARHCLRDNHSQNAASYCLASGAVEFRTFAAPHQAYKVADLTPTEKRTLRKRKRVRDDYVQLRTSSSIAGISEPTQAERPGAYAPAFIMGYHDLVANSLGAASSNWAGKIRWSRPYCSFIRSNGPCAVTKCQTIAGFSGVPVWSVNDNGETRLSGIQVEGGSSSFDACLNRNYSQSLGSQGNLAISTFIED